MNLNRADLYNITQKACLNHLSIFAKEFWDVIVPNKLIWNWHMDAICDEIQEADERVFLRLPKLYDLIINVPPGTSKTKLVSILSTAWEFTRVPSIKVFVGSYSDTAVSSIADEVKLIMRSPKYRYLFPWVNIRADRDSLHNFKTTKNGEFFAFTVGGTLTSKHADILKVDDALNPKQAASEQELKNVNSFFDTTLPSRKTDKEVTLTTLVMQRLSENDPTGHLLGKPEKRIKHICFPGTIGPNIKPEKYRQFYLPSGLMDPYRLTSASLKELKTDLGSYGYAGQIDQNPAPADGEVWQKWFKEVPDHLFPNPSHVIDLSNDWDLAFTSEEDNAASAYVQSGTVGANIFIFDIDWKWLEFPQLIRWMKTIRGDHYIEAKATGKSAKQTLSQQGIIAIEVQVVGGADKVARARAATPIVEAGSVYIKKSMADRLYNDSRQGILRFPKGKHKDLADALAQMLQRRSKRTKITVGDPDSGDGQSAVVGKEINPLEDWI